MKINYIKLLSILTFSTLLLQPELAFAGPASTNYELKEYGFGSGGSDGLGGNSTNYSVFGSSGESGAGSQLSSTNYTAEGGLIYTMQANQVNATLTNPSNYYNKLHLVFSSNSNPSDSQYLIAISTDNFVTDTTHYVQGDTTVGTTKTWQTFSSWSSGVLDIIGLAANTTYTVKVAVRQGNYTQIWGATTQAATINPTLTFDIDTGGGSDPGNTSPPYSIDLGTLTLGSVVTTTNRVWLTLATNATTGGYVYIRDANGGLQSSTIGPSSKITSANGDLSVATEGFGIQGASTTQTSGTLAFTSPYNGGSQNVGAVGTTYSELLNSAASPIVGGRGSMVLKAKASTTRQAATDYADTLTIVAAASF